MKSKIKISLLVLMLCLLGVKSYSQKKIFKRIDTISLKSQGDDYDKFLKSELNNSDFYSFKEKKQNQKTDKLGFEHRRFDQFYKNIRIEYSTVILHGKNNKNYIINGEYVDGIEINITPHLKEKEALSFALNYVNAERYMWEEKEEEKRLRKIKNDLNATYYPKGELVICKDFLNEPQMYKLAYKFEIYAVNPFRRDYIYVDAEKGDVIHINPIMQSVGGTAATRYSGSRTIETQQNGTIFRLRDVSRGGGIETYDLNNSTLLSSAVDFEDNDNNWTDAEYNNTAMDNAALDVHWGAMMTYDYFNSVHGRNSYDNSGGIIQSYVHRGTNWLNARWTGSEMLFGDGDGTNFDPLTALDIIAHEFGHGVCTNSANLVYQSEPGAINEGLSDIWAACVENFAAPEKSIWLCGEDIDLRSGHSGVRSMSNPNAENQPDTYGGTNWVTVAGCTPSSLNDFCGVHTNSGVMNYWFYLLCVGGNGTNDIGNSFKVTGINIDDAADIVYRAETVYMTANTTFSDARIHTIQAAEDLFGVNSQQAISTMSAWFAVGVGGCDIFPFENANVTSNTTVNGCTIEVENVNVNNGAKLILDAENGTTIKTNFKVELGSELEIK